MPEELLQSLDEIEAMARTMAHLCRCTSSIPADVEFSDLGAGMCAGIAERIARVRGRLSGGLALVE